MNLFTSLRERYLIKPVADVILKGLTPPLPLVDTQVGITAQQGLQAFTVPIGFNNALATYNKRMIATNSVDWPVLRSLSVNHETTRAAINVRKREIIQLGYEVVDVNDETDPTATAKQRETAREMLTNIGGEGVRFREVVDKMIEDTLVLDACVFYKQRTRDGQLLRIVPIDATTIKLRVDESGLRPLAPDIAFEQWIRGSKTADLTTEDMVYEMMNPRSDNPYGLSPLESLVLTLDTSMRAMLYNLGYFSDNSVPQGFINVPEEWKVQQIKEYTEYLHALISGPKAQAKIYPIPARAKYIPTSKPTDFAFKDLFDYLDRKVCMMFDVTPQELGLSLQQYKENAEGQDKIQMRKGIKPLANFLSEIFTDLLRNELGFPNFAFKFTGLDARFTPEDAKTLIPIGVVSIDEVRNDMGLAKLDVDNFIITSQGVTPVDQIEENAQADLEAKKNPPMPFNKPGNQPQENVSRQGVDPEDKNPKSAQKMQKISGDNKMLGRLEKSSKYKSFHSKVEEMIKKQLLPFTHEATIEKVSTTSKVAGVNASAVEDNLPSFRIEGLGDYLKWATVQGGQQALDTLNIKGQFKPNPKTAKMLADRENYLIDSVDDTTKDYIVDQLSQGHAAQMTNAEIAQQIHDDIPEISKFRANMITNTETANATMQAELQTYQEQGVTKKVWVLSEDIGDECGENADEGAIDVGDDFSSGDDAPPAHPNAVLAGSTFFTYGKLEEMVGADYEGSAVLIRTSGDHDLTIGMNHPILTQRGMVKASKLTESDYLIYDNRLNKMTSEVDFDKIPLVEDAFQSLLSGKSKSLIATSAHDLHGDKEFCKGEIQVIEPTNSLLPIFDSFFIEKLRENNLMSTNMQAILFSSNSPSDLCLDTIDLSSSGLMSGTLSSYHLLHIQSIQYVEFKGKAFDATTETGIYNSNGFVVSNCRCFLQADIKSIEAMDKPDLKKDDGAWATINGAKVHFDADGNVDMGPKAIIDEHNNAFKSHLVSDLQGKARYGKELPANIGQTIKNINIDAAKNPLDAARMIVAALPKDLASNRDIISSIKDATNYQHLLNYKAGGKSLV